MTTVVYQRVNCFLKHTLLVLYDYFGSHKLRELFETVVSVDDPAIKVVQVGGCVSAAVKRNHRSDFRRDDGDNVKHHPFGLVSGATERFGNLKSLYDLNFLLTRNVVELFFKLFGELFNVYLAEQFFYSLRSHADAEIVFVFFIHIAIFAFGKHLLLFKRSAARIENYILRKVKHLFKRAGRNVKHGCHS